MRKQWLGLALSQTLTLARPRPRPFSSSSASAAAVGDGVAVKKVTRPNFEQALEELRPRIRDSDFVAVDLEMTGVTSAPWRDYFEFDRSDVRYLKVKDSADKFAVVQVGVCPFRWDQSKGSFVAHPHNFYIFPRKELPIDGPSYEFLCQTTSIDFLAKYQFDFNACIYEGISYLSRAQEAEALQNLSSAYEDGVSNSSYNSEECVEIPIASTADILFTERMKNKFREWRDGILRSPDGGSPLEASFDGPKLQLQTVFFKMRPAIPLNGFSSHQLKLIKLHHCRRCGGLFCHGCTQQRMILRWQGDSPVRICYPCKKLEDATQFELKYGHKNRATKGRLWSLIASNSLYEDFCKDLRQNFDIFREVIEVVIMKD